MLKCELSELIAKTDIGLKTHNERNHLNCDWCDYICDDKLKCRCTQLDTLEYRVEMLQNCRKESSISMVLLLA